MATTVGHTSHNKAASSECLYVGRPSDYGNPFKMGRDGTREQVILKFKAWWMHPDQTALRKRSLHECRDKVLLCWCWPEACHAQVIAEYVDGYWNSLAAFRNGNQNDPPI